MNFPTIWICVLLASSGLVVSSRMYFFDEVDTRLSTWKLSVSNNKFALDLLKDFSQRTPKNLIFCPISIYTTLGMLYYGARSSTAKELERTLKYQNTSLSKPEVIKGFRSLLKDNLITVNPGMYVLDVANTILVNEKVGLSSAYKSKVEKYFKARIELADFDKGEQEVLDNINGWVRNQTRGKIQGIIDHIDKSMDVIAVNAAYFKSKWVAPFPEKNTQQDHFYNAGKTKKLVPMMEQKGPLKYHRDNKVSVVQLPFLGRNISMFVILPHKLTGLVEIEKSLSHETLLNYIHSLRHKYILVTMPKFNLTFYENLVPNLNRLGARKMFQPSVANFSGMVPHQEITIGEVRHKAIIEVNEAGVEASGVTASLSFKSMPVSESFHAHFLADHPFIYVILDERTRLILFMGHVWNL